MTANVGDRLQLVTNIPRADAAAAAFGNIDHQPLADFLSGGLLRCLPRLAARPHCIVIDDDNRALRQLCLLKWLVPFVRWRLVSLDILLSRPFTRRERMRAFVTRLLLRKVDLFLLYFHDLTGYQRYFGITPARAAYVPFKSTVWDERDSLPPAALAEGSDGDYVLATGRTKRDFATFLSAMRLTDLPGVLMHQSAEVMTAHGTSVPRADVPDNVRLLHHDGRRESWIEMIAGARVVVLPILDTTISSSGISTYLDAMALRRCVVITEGPATRGLLTDEAILVPATNAPAMAAAITAAWTDPALRRSTSQRGYAYAAACQGEQRFLHDILSAVDRLHREAR